MNVKVKTLNKNKNVRAFLRYYSGKQVILTNAVILEKMNIKICSIEIKCNGKK